MREAQGQALVLRPGKGRPIDLGGFRMTVKATREETGSVSLRAASSARFPMATFRLARKGLASRQTGLAPRRL